MSLAALSVAAVLRAMPAGGLWRCRCALMPAPPSAPLSRTPSAAQDRLPEEAHVSLLPEPVERPLNRYLHKRDGYYNRIVPDWALQYRTAEQQYRYEGSFAVFAREVTEEGAVVQDAVTGLFGFVGNADLGDSLPAPGALIHGAKCIAMDNSVVTSPALGVLRLQTGVVFEWNEMLGEGYIMPSEEQDAWRMIRVLRRDIHWHDSRRLFVGQFVQFETVLPDEVPIDANDEPLAPFALRVRSPEVRFSLRDSFAEPPAAGRPSTRALATHLPLPPDSGRVLPESTKAHPVLGRWLDNSVAAGAETPLWMWEPPMRHFDDELEFQEQAPIVPLRLKRLPFRKRGTRILTHEVAAQMGDRWKEPAQREGFKDFAKQKPPGRHMQQKMALKLEGELQRERQRERRSWKLRMAKLRKSDH